MEILKKKWTVVIAAGGICAHNDCGNESRWLLLFTNQADNYRPPLSFVKEVLKGFHYLPCEITVKPGDSLFEIALQCTGEGELYWELADENELPDADYIVSVQVLKAPERWLVRN